MNEELSIFVGLSIVFASATLCIFSAVASFHYIQYNWPLPKPGICQEEK